MRSGVYFFEDEEERTAEPDILPAPFFEWDGADPEESAVRIVELQNLLEMQANLPKTPSSELSTAAIFEQLATALYWKADYALALTLFQRALPILEMKLGAENPTITTIALNLAMCKEKMTIEI